MGGVGQRDEMRSYGADTGSFSCPKIGLWFRQLTERRGTVPRDLYPGERGVFF